MSGGSIHLVVEDGRGLRRLSAADLPLALGGPESDIQVSTDSAAEPVAWIGEAEGRLFVQPAEGGREVSCNGIALRSSHWLHAGDELRLGSARIRVAAEAGGLKFTVSAAPQPSGQPVLVPPSRPAATVSGGEAIRPVEFRPQQAAARRRRPLKRSLARWLVVLALVVLAAAAALVFTARPVRIEIEPLPDSLEVGGGPVFELGDRYLMWPGDYTLAAATAGYRPLREEVEITSESNQALRYTLERLPGLLEVESGQLTGVAVSIDGEVVARTPMAEPIEVAPGVHELRASADRHQDHIEELTVEGGGVRQTVAVSLVPRWAPVGFSSEPAGAMVTVEGREVGRTPVTVDLGAGRHRIELSLAGRKPHRGVVDVEANRPQSLPRVRLSPLDGKLTIASQPSGATVALDGEFRGETPLELVLPPGRSYTVSVSKSGHESGTRSVELGAGESIEVAIELPTVVGEVEISSWPPDAELFIDGESRGNATQTLELPTRPHKVEVRREGYETFSRTVTPTPGLPQAVEARLQTAEEIRAAAMPAVVNTAEGHELRLIPAGRFKMGAPRREPGRRSNEVIREVELSRRFYLASQEVSNRQFRRFMSSHKSGQLHGKSLEVDHHPAVRVSWQEAAGYCNWLSHKEGLPLAYERRGGRLEAVRPFNTGYRLPTEAEWAWAARYPDGKTDQKYPWGDALPVAPGSGNYADAAAAGAVPEVLASYNDGFPGTAPVDAFEPNAAGILNLGGNVAEWVNDYYAVRSSTTVERDPQGPESGEHRVIRGSSWVDGTISKLRLSYRDYGTAARPDVGFRVGRYAE